MISLKDKLINLLYEDDVEEEKEIPFNIIKRRRVLAVSIIINFILNILYVSLYCYSGETKYVGLMVFVISFIWSIISLVSSYKLVGKYSRTLFFLNIFAIMFVSKI